ncbi:diguanylate cyclase (GGDEF)-like protein [Bradyrhizobium japonicum]
MLFFWATGEPTLKAIAVNNLLVSGAMVTVLFIYYRDFADLVSSRKSLLAQQAATQALSDENFRLANLDSLTELPNRRRFFAELSSAFTDAERRRVRVAVGIIDLDGFKPINDNYGHSVGDRVLIEAGRRIREVCEGFGPQRVEFARLGGDEFGLVVCGDPEDDDLMRLGQRIGEQVKLPYQLDTAHTGLSCSIGFALFPSSATSAEALYECADYSLYHAKRHLRGRTVIFSSELEAEIRSRGVIENLLRTADFSTEMDLVFQPIVDAMSEHTAGFEVLARWRSSRPRPGLTGRLHSGRRAHRPDPAADASAAGPRARDGKDLARPHPPVVQPLSSRRLRSRGHFAADLDHREKRVAAAPDRFRDHRDRRHLRLRARAAIDRDAEGHGLRHFTG